MALLFLKGVSLIALRSANNQHQSSSSSSAPVSFETIELALQSTTEAHNTATAILSSNITSEEVECAICQAPLTSQNYITTNCNHQFHEGCINQWMITQNKDSCPICRQILQESNFQKHDVGIPPKPLPPRTAAQRLHETRLNLRMMDDLDGFLELMVEEHTRAVAAAANNNNNHNRSNIRNNNYNNNRQHMHIPGNTVANRGSWCCLTRCLIRYMSPSCCKRFLWIAVALYTVITLFIHYMDPPGVGVGTVDAMMRYLGTIWLFAGIILIIKVCFVRDRHLQVLFPRGGY